MLHLGDRQLRIVQVAAVQLHAGGNRMIMRIDDTGHDHTAVQIDDFRPLADERARARVRPDVDDVAAADGDRLPNAVLAIHRIDESVVEHRVRG